MTIFTFYFSALGKGNAVGSAVVKKERYNVCKYLQIEGLEKAYVRRNWLNDQNDPESARKRFVSKCYPQLI